MAVQRYRYRKTGPGVDQLDLRSKSDATATLIGQSQGQLIDIDIEETLIADLDDYMDSLGYARIAGPGVVGTPGDAAEFVRRTGDAMSGNLTFSGGATAVVPNPVGQSDAVNLQTLNSAVVAGRVWREAVLVKEQLLDGATGGILQSILGDVQGQPADTNTFFFNDTATTETFTFRTTAVAPFDVQIGATAQDTETNLIAAINADSTLWSAVATSSLDPYFSGLPPTQFVIYRTAVPAGGSADDRVYGTLNSQSNIQIVEFQTAGTLDYTAQAGTQSDLPSADPAAKRFGFGRQYSDLITVESHLVVEVNQQWTWNADDEVWQLTGTSAANASSELLWGAGNLASSTTTRYLYPCYSDQLAQTDVISIRAPRNGTLKNLRVRINQVAGDTDNLTFTLLQNGAPTSLSVTMAANTTDGADLSNAVIVSANDLLALRVTKAGSIAGNPPRDVVATIEYAV
jgi:hypothetical protein